MQKGEGLGSGVRGFGSQWSVNYNTFPGVLSTVGGHNDPVSRAAVMYGVSILVIILYLTSAPGVISRRITLMMLVL